MRRKPLHGAVSTGAVVEVTAAPGATRQRAPAGGAAGPVAGVYAAVVFAGAALVFWVEPLFGKLVLPLLGGAPAVWNTCLLFFQGALLAAYLYVHLGTRWLGVRRHALVHVALLAASLLVLPLGLPAGWLPDAGGHPAPWLLGVLTVALGPPFVLLAATSPLLQRWLAAQDHPDAADPYHLYATGSLGSLIALLAFPFVLEPTVGLEGQMRLWSLGYGAVALATAACALPLLLGAGAEEGAAARSAPRAEVAPPRPGGPAPGSRGAPDGLSSPRSPSARDRLAWTALAFVPSSLLLGVTTHLTTDVAAVPLLWVAPLALYLLTFAAAFARARWAPRRPTAVLQAALVATLAIVAFWGLDVAPRWLFPLHLGVFFATALVLHGELAARRPAARHLTDFYLWVALGGALGGVFNALVAPALFDSVVEYEWMLVAACALRPSLRARPPPRLRRLARAAAPALPALVLALVVVRGAVAWEAPEGPAFWGASLAAGGVLLLLSGRPLPFAAGVGAVLAAGPLLGPAPDELLHAERTFFGTYRVTRDSAGPRHLLEHGTTLHGAQVVVGPRRLEPLGYYHASGPAGRAFAALDNALEGARVGVVGLGVGALACHGRPGQRWTFYELDPAVVRLARDPRLFSYLAECPPRVDVVVGDARLTLAREPDASFQLLVLDAFTSDAVPVHLLTREALDLYARLLAPDGVLLVHVSNRYVDLEPVLARLAADAGLAARMSRYIPGPVGEADGAAASEWAAMARDAQALEPLTTGGAWWALQGGRGVRPWTDDFSDLAGALAW